MVGLFFSSSFFLVAFRLIHLVPTHCTRNELIITTRTRSEKRKSIMLRMAYTTYNYTYKRTRHITCINVHIYREYAELSAWLTVNGHNRDSIFIQFAVNGKVSNCLSHPHKLTHTLAFFCYRCRLPQTSTQMHVHIHLLISQLAWCDVRKQNSLHSKEFAWSKFKYTHSKIVTFSLPKSGARRQLNDIRTATMLTNNSLLSKRYSQN